MPEPVEIEPLGARLRRAVEEIAPGRGPTVWLAENAVDEHGEPVMNVNTAADFLRPQPRRGWIAYHRMEAIAKRISWHPTELVLGNAYDLGCPPMPDQSMFAGSLPRECDRLPQFAQAALREQAVAACRLAGLLGNTD